MSEHTVRPKITTGLKHNGYSLFKPKLTPERKAAIHQAAQVMMITGAVGFIEDPIFFLMIASGLANPAAGLLVGAKIGTSAALFFSGLLLFANTSADDHATTKKI